MTDRAFVDTNVLVYSVDDADLHKRDVARALLVHRVDELVVSAQVLSEFYVVVTRKLAQPMSGEDAAAAVSELSKLPVVPNDATLVRDAIALSREGQLSFWDAQIVAAARTAGCETLYTEDLASDTTIAGVRILNPFAIS
jgi:predicted nucleic acid-binding protein